MSYRINSAFSVAVASTVIPLVKLQLVTLESRENACVIQVKFLDLTLPQYWLPRYDWVLSMEVLEHIPAEFEVIALDNIDRATGHGVVLSWATLYQKGFHHVNNRSPAYVNQTMFNRGFRIDLSASRTLRNAATVPWLRKNLRVYIRK